MQHLTTAQVVAVREASAELINVRHDGVRDAARAQFAAAAAELNRRLAPLTVGHLARIAARFGLDPMDAVVRENAEQAARHHGRPGDVGHWACDGRGFYDAERHLVGLLEQEVHAAETDDRAAADFARDAYGEG